MNELSGEVLIKRAQFLSVLRKFFEKKNYLEMDTPCLKAVPSMEPYLDPFLVRSPSRKEKGYLITSPEYSLKEILSKGLEKIYEITHTFRSGEEGSLFHSAEFLMLEFYTVGISLEDLMNFCTELLEVLDCEFQAFGFDRNKVRKISVEESLRKYAHCGISKSELDRVILERRLSEIPAEKRAYEDSFFIVFLNLVEAHLPKEFVFLYDYPPELAALSKIESGFAKRFELYYGSLELGNAFEELTDPVEQISRFCHEQDLRKNLGKEVFSVDPGLERALREGIPDSCGISIGLDRLLLCILGGSSLREISPYYGKF
ncbi:elongation factor P--(R)-beta-lysine ligase [Leptospira borgpetersenii serovar Hardjo-bovis]|uniref:Putative EF-P lysine aminoacylase GenX n=1 Tax=Leptospira borgpetersenii serovar Hardjo-bovis str. Sponselee TaxID=1303729 RepID=M6C4X5_LEPBO|nr:amino acid--tRNA ligase-related protein [Leptospira borgpetersenii]ABJ80565.1 tRNA synthetase class II (D, K and N) [Leptospira borgpetersenii serovar Hardjo-bovis str. L550]AMX60012.1 lysyl-tRNA synthetase [Leptospira borgpetersenii serovar Hardjo]AMX63242.1 lysyl-tRNA synthetase [Leptospira borgpetersenii serovar Hardjo]AMX66486.1 lysyl-tRNA synthetase [Leptospira borgpetersenii serovar Hardjo]AMX69713.1 lysyl-tRNA synthetase [Leptospira borgpetersenii serovar Hardjo]